MNTVQLIPILKIRVVNPRVRAKAKFNEIVTNMTKVGLKKPITVCPRAGSGGEYDLVCGQGRLEAFKNVGQTHVPAFVIKATEEERHIMSLVENIARRTPDSLAVARDIAGLEARGYNAAQIAAKVGVTEHWVRDILKLHATGEEVLLGAVHRGELPIRVALEISNAKDEDLKRCLAEAYERGELNGKQIARARALVEGRLANGRKALRSGRGKTKKLSADDVVKAYKRAAQKQALFVRKARVCDTMLRIVCSALRELLADEHFVTLLRAEGLHKMPRYLAEQVKQKAAR
jgi:ParB family transcriptional regulator, chromosome partitioning protein